MTMARTSTYLNFNGNTEEAFAFYGSVFGTEPVGHVTRMGDVPASPGMPTLSDKDKKAIMHIALPILGGHVLMGTDVLESMGHKVNFGDNLSLMLEPDTREDADKLFARLAEGGKVELPLQDMFWGDYFGQLTDKFGVKWMFNCAGKKA
jgi:PhnB protein